MVVTGLEMEVLSKGKRGQILFSKFLMISLSIKFNPINLGRGMQLFLHITGFSELLIAVIKNFFNIAMMLRMYQINIIHLTKT